MNTIFKSKVKLVSQDKKTSIIIIYLVGALDIKSCIRRIEKKYGSLYLVTILSIKELPFDDDIILNIL